jgi:nucleotide-binding universal stress UspA family protein
MAMFKRILAPTDFSDLSSAGVRCAYDLAKQNAAELIVFNVAVVDESNAIDKRELADHRTRLDQFVSATLPESTQVKIHKLVAGGQPFSAILDCAEAERADLIVISSHGRSGLSRALIGSVTDKILRGSHRPVLVVPTGK